MRKLIFALGILSFLTVNSCATYDKYGAPKKNNRKKVSCRSVKTKQFGKVY